MIVWRHGRTKWNATGRFQGQADVPLDDLGREQAQRAAPLLAAMKPSVIVSSDLSRATETAGYLAALVDLPVRTDARLREIHVGTWEGLTADEVVHEDPDLAHRYFRGEDIRRSATGETVAETSARVCEALAEEGTAASDGSTVVVVMHGLAARVGVCRLVGFPPDTWHLLGGMHNCAWINVEWHIVGGYWRIRDYNAVAPLGEVTPDFVGAGGSR